MSAQTCGCSTETCGCCEGIRTITPQSTANRPGLSALNYRVGTHGAFLESMKAGLTTMIVEAPGADGQTIETFAPLRNLTTRDTADFSIALLDGWATVADVLTFYQERIADEGYLGTATERRSILELSRLIGYSLRPGVSASVFLSYTIDENQATPTTIPAGARSQSVPGPGEFPQSFETSEDLEARSDWNNLQVRLTQPQNITLASALSQTRLFVQGINTNLKAGDSILFVFDDNGDPSVMRTVQKTEAQFDQDRTLVSLQPVAADVLAGAPILADFVAAIELLVTNATSGAGRRMAGRAEEILTQSYLGAPSAAADWAAQISNAADGTAEAAILAAFADFGTKLNQALANLPGSSPVVVTDPSKFITPLLLPAKLQVADSLKLTRNLGGAFQQNRDANPQLLIKFAPKLALNFYGAWANANVNAAPPSLKGVFTLRAQAALFGATAPKQPTYNGTVPKKPSLWDEWDLDSNETTASLFLDQAYDSIQPHSYAVIELGDGTREVRKITAAQAAQRSAYGVSGKSTKLTFATDWRDTVFNLGDLRPVLVRAQSEPLSLVEEPLAGDVQGQEIPLAELYDSLKSGRWVILSGERTDIPGVTGVTASELLMISGLRQDFDPNLPGDKTHTTLLLATTTAYSYKRDSLVIHGNVVKATNGETRNEILGNGDGTQPLQKFTLKQPPLTFVSASNPSGVNSTLHVFVNNIEWHEADSLAGSDSKSRNFVTKTDDAGKTSVIFGDGENGARLPTGSANVIATYRNGIGKPGNVKAEQISLLQTRPLGVKAVINPLEASGGADAESRDQARENAPLAVMSLDRLVSVQDYADFARTFAGIGKASAQKLSFAGGPLVYVTIAGADDIPIEKTSDLYQNLVAALAKYGDPQMTLRVEFRELLALALSANVRLLRDYQWEPVATEIRSTLLDTFGFSKRALGQPALSSEVIACIQNVEGVEYVDVDAFGGVPEKVSQRDGSRVLLTLDQLALAVQQIANPGAFQKFEGNGQSLVPRRSGSVRVNQAGTENGALRPAQLAIFTDAVPDTLILNQIT